MNLALFASLRVSNARTAHHSLVFTALCTHKPSPLFCCHGVPRFQACSRWVLPVLHVVLRGCAAMCADLYVQCAMLCCHRTQRCQALHSKRATRVSPDVTTGDAVEEMRQQVQQVTILVAGGPRTGKTSLCRRFVDKEFECAEGALFTSGARQITVGGRAVCITVRAS